MGLIERRPIYSFDLVRITQTCVIDDENEKLQNHIMTIFRILPLVAPFPPPVQDVFIISGTGELVNDSLNIQDIRSIGRVDKWQRSFYIESQWDEFIEWASIYRKKHDLLDEWRNCFDHYKSLFIEKESNRQVFESYRSFEEAMKSSQLEFKMPNLVRAVECIVVCWGHEKFAELTLSLIGELSLDLPFSIARNTKTLLEDLYQLRNDCSHGKHFAYSIEKKTGNPPDDKLISKYEFLAEWVARKLINDSFINESILQNTHHRDALVSA